MHRLFVAIRPPQPVRDVLFDTMEGLDPARWQDDGQLHLTLRFVGGIETPLANDLAAALGQVAADPFDLALQGVGCFDEKGRVHTLWAGVSPSPGLLALQRKVEQACQRCGLEPEHRRFAPHVTVARINAPLPAVEPWLARHRALASAPWRVEAFRLYESTLAHTGAHYEPVLQWALT